MKVIFVEIDYIKGGWEKTNGKTLYETRDVPIPLKGQCVYVNDIAYTVQTISHHYFTVGCIDNCVRVELLKNK